MRKENRFAEAGAVHGVKYIFGSKSSKFTRIFWTFSVLLSIAGFFYYLYPAWRKLHFEPEILTRSRERYVYPFPLPAVTICPNIISTKNYTTYFDSQSEIRREKNWKPTPDECRISYAHLQWCYREAGHDQHHVNHLKYCPKKVVESVNFAETILHDAWNYRDFMVFDRQIVPQVTSLASYGPCYIFNGLSYSSLFNTEIIHDDFKQYKKNVFGMEIEENTTWTPETNFDL